MREDNTEACPLAGDRAIEWSWVTAHLPDESSRVLDLGCVGSVLTGIASRLGHQVTAVDLNDIEYEMPGVMFRKGDINVLDFGDATFDVIMNCSMIEHIGLGSRYGSGRQTAGDLMAMEKLRNLVAPDGTMILTVPMGVDATFEPYHRIYGAARLPRLLAGYKIVQEEFWTKERGGLWNQCDKKTALSTKGAPDYYALGLFLLGK